MPAQLPTRDRHRARARRADASYSTTSGKPPIASGELEPWATAIRALAAHENVVCKLSGMVTEAAWDTWTVDDLRPYAEVVLDAFGPERLMFGSDWPVCLLAAPYAAVVAAAASSLGG